MKEFKINKSITSRNDEMLDKYLQEISRLDRVDQEEEVELSKRIQMGDEKALERLVHANLRFVVSVAKQNQHQ